MQHVSDLTRICICIASILHSASTCGYLAYLSLFLLARTSRWCWWRRLLQDSSLDFCWRLEKSSCGAGVRGGKIPPYLVNLVLICLRIRCRLLPLLDRMLSYPASLQEHGDALACGAEVRVAWEIGYRCRLACRRILIAISINPSIVAC